MNRNLRKLFAVSVVGGVVLTGGSAAARTLHAASTPAKVATPAVGTAVAPDAVEVQQALPAVAVDQALPVSARTTGSMPIQGSWDRQTPQGINVHQGLGHIAVAQQIPGVNVGAIGVNLPAAASYDVSSNGASAGVSSNLAGVNAGVSTNGPALADISTSALSLNNELKVASR